MSDNIASRDGSYSREDVDREREIGDARFEIVFRILKEVASGRMDQAAVRYWIADTYPSRVAELDEPSGPEPFPPGAMVGEKPCN